MTQINAVNPARGDADQQSGMQLGATPLNMDSFLANAEKRAYRMAMLATRQHSDALDIVQDSMFKLVQHYSEKPGKEWAPLFQTILQNNILQWHRQQNRFRRLFSFSNDLADEEDSGAANEPAELRDSNPEQLILQRLDTTKAIDAVSDLPVRQQQAFLLRAWEGYDVATTAKIMGCSDGSVKTHYSRALSALRKQLEESIDDN